jgi:hypothetical protein
MRTVANPHLCGVFKKFAGTKFGPLAAAFDWYLAPIIG